MRFGLHQDWETFDVETMAPYHVTLTFTLSDGETLVFRMARYDAESLADELNHVAVVASC